MSLRTMRTMLVALSLLLYPAAGFAQANPLTAFNVRLYGGIKQLVLGIAERMPETHYAFKPTESVRTYGQILGHIADSQYYFCAQVLAEPKPTLNVEKTKTSKADLIAALKAAFAYCDRAYAQTTDQSGAVMIEFMGNDAPKTGVFTTNSVHTMEHYGNLVTYLRMKNFIPPTSDPAVMKQLRGK